MRVLTDYKTGFVGLEARVQEGAYSLCTKVDGTPLPVLDGGLIVKVDARGCAPVWIRQPQLAHYGQTFLGIKQLWDDFQALNAVKNTDTYQLWIEGTEITYPRVTAVIKATVAKPHLTNYLIKQAVRYTLTELIETRKTPREVLDAFDAGCFDPQAGAKGHMESRGAEGKAVHTAAELYLKGLPVEIPDDQEWVAKAFGHLQKFCQRHDAKLVPGFSECTVVNTQAGYAGTLDAILDVTPCAAACCEEVR